MTSRWEELSRIFAEAAELEGTERDAYLRERCGGDEMLENEVRSLLSHHRARARSNGTTPVRS